MLARKAGDSALSMDGMVSFLKQDITSAPNKDETLKEQGTPTRKRLNVGRHFRPPLRWRRRKGRGTAAW